MRRLTASILMLSLAAFAGGVPLHADPQNAAEAPARPFGGGQPVDPAVEQEFIRKMTNVTLVGAFTLDGDDAKAPKSDRYDVSSVRRVRDDTWIVTARMKVGERMVDVPVPLSVYWAGDTPVLTLTNTTIPGMGTFTARVMIYGDRYAGTWQHDAKGGHMWGKLEKKDVPATEPVVPPAGTRPAVPR